MQCKMQIFYSKVLAANSATPQPPSRCTFGTNLKTVGDFLEVKVTEIQACQRFLAGAHKELGKKVTDFFKFLEYVSPLITSYVLQPKGGESQVFQP